MGDNDLKPLTTHVMIDKKYIYITDSFGAVRVSKKLIPDLNLNIKLKKDEVVVIHKKELKKLKGNFEEIVGKEILFADKKQQITQALFRIEDKDYYITPIENILKSIISRCEIKKGWNINGNRYHPTMLYNINNLLMEISDVDVPVINLNVSENKGCVITHDNYSIDEFVAVIMNITI